MYKVVNSYLFRETIFVVEVDNLEGSLCVLEVFKGFGDESRTYHEGSILRYATAYVIEDGRREG
jgi:hypothetical protein